MGIKRAYSRDKRSPTPTSENVSRVMSAIKAKNTKPELLLRKALRENDLIGYRLHPRHVAGRPDICYTRKKLAIFVNGCYWHRCPNCDLPLPKSNKKFWKDKFQRNVTRDEAKIRQLKAEGWTVLVFWECELKSGLDNAVEKIKHSLSMV